MDEIQNKLDMLEDLKEEASDLGNKVLKAGENGGLGDLADGGNKRSSESSESGERDPDDTYSLGSFFSDLESFGSDAAEKLEETKKFFTKLGAVVAIIGTCINTGTSMVDALNAGNITAAILTGILLIAIQIPTTLAMLFVFLKDWAVMTVTGFMKAKEELEELASNLDSFVDDFDSDENDDDKLERKKPVNGEMKAENETLRRDLEKTKVKNNYKSVDETGNSNPDKTANGVGKKGHNNSISNGKKTTSGNQPPDLPDNVKFRKMEEGRRPDALKNRQERTRDTRSDSKIKPGETSSGPKTATNKGSRMQKPSRSTPRRESDRRKGDNSKAMTQLPRETSGNRRPNDSASKKKEDTAKKVKSKTKSEQKSKKRTKDHTNQADISDS